MGGDDEPCEFDLLNELCEEGDWDCEKEGGASSMRRPVELEGGASSAGRGYLGIVGGGADDICE